MDDQTYSRPRKPRRIKVKILPTARTMKKAARRAYPGGSGSRDALPGGRSRAATSPPVVGRGLRTRVTGSSQRGSSAASDSSAAPSPRSTTSSRSGYASSVGVPAAAQHGMVPVPVRIADPRMLHWMNEYDEVDGPISGHVYRPTFLTYRRDDDLDAGDDVDFRFEVAQSNYMSSYYQRIKAEIPFHLTMIALNSFSVINSFYLLWKFSELGEFYAHGLGPSPLKNHRYLQFHVLLAALISFLELLRRTYDVPLLAWLLWSRQTMTGLFSYDMKAKLDDLKSLLFLLYCTWSVPGLTYETMRFFGYDLRVASPFQAFFPLAFVSYAALAIVRPLRGLSYGTVSSNFNTLWKIPVYVSSGALILFYLIRGYAVPAFIIALHTWVLVMSHYTYLNVQVVNKFLVLLVQEKGFGLKMLAASFLNWAYMKYTRGLVECFNLYEDKELHWAILRCSDTVSYNTFMHRLGIAFNNIAASVTASKRS